MRSTRCDTRATRSRKPPTRTTGSLREYGPLDLVHLGLGPDGHTASLFPGSPALEERERLVVATGDDLHPHPRLTLTFPALAQSRLAVVTVAGEGKREALQRVKAGDDLPAARVSGRARDLARRRGRERLTVGARPMDA